MVDVGVVKGLSCLGNEALLGGEKGVVGHAGCAGGDQDDGNHQRLDDCEEGGAEW